MRNLPLKRQRETGAIHPPATPARGACRWRPGSWGTGSEMADEHLVCEYCKAEFDSLEAYVEHKQATHAAE